MSGLFFHMTRTARIARSYLPTFGAATREEKVNFVRFSHSDHELSDMSNGNLKGDGHDGQDGNADKQTPLNVDELFNVDSENERNAINEWQAGWTVTNAIQGMFIVSFPYAVIQGGYWAIIAMIVVAYICCHTGKILVQCLYEEDETGKIVRLRSSYVDIAEDVWGKKYGGKIVNCAQIIELLMTCILYVLLCGDLILGSFPDSPVDLSSWIMISTVPLLACAFLKSLRRVSLLSFWCSVAHMVINAIILIYCLTQAAHWHWGDVQIKIDIWTFPISMGIVVFSYTSQIFLPSLEGNLVNKTKFSCMMHWTHALAGVFKSLFSYIGFLTWGFETKEVITNNLPTAGFKAIVNLILVIKALLSYPLPYFAAVELLQITFFQGQATLLPSCFDQVTQLKVWAVAARLILVIFTMLLAIFIPHFAILMGLIGSFTGTMLSFVWPCYFHLKLKWPAIPLYIKVFDIFIIILGIFIGGIGIYYSSHALDRAFHGDEPRPFGIPHNKKV